jgi:hypothetical protein
VSVLARSPCVTDVTPFFSTEIRLQSAHDDLLVQKLVERSSMSSLFGRRAVVVDGGIGGLSVARESAAAVLGNPDMTRAAQFSRE